MAKMDSAFLTVRWAALLMSLLTMPALFAGCGSLGDRATTASGPPSDASARPAAPAEASVPPERPGIAQSDANLAPVVQGPAEAELVSFNAPQSVEKQSTAHLTDVTKQATPRRVEHVNDRSFGPEVLESDATVLVDFYADWCGPCKKLSPVLDELARETPDVRIVKVNVDGSPQSATEYRVRSIPTLILFKNGKPVARRGGLMNKASLQELISQP